LAIEIRVGTDKECADLPLREFLEADAEASKERALLARLGNVLYWLCCALAALLAVFGVWAAFQPSEGIKTLALFAGIAFGFCLLGSAFKYALPRVNN
jgi:zinc transporter ZupT